MSRNGERPWSLSLTKLDTNLPFSWKEQMKLFGMESTPKILTQAQPCESTASPEFLSCDFRSCRFVGRRNLAAFFVSWGAVTQNRGRPGNRTGGGRNAENGAKRVVSDVFHAITCKTKKKGEKDCRMA